MTSLFFDSLEPRNYFAAGALDPTFGTGGVEVFRSSAVGGPTPQGVIEEADGKIVVGTSGAILRFNQNGSIDTTFGVNGMVAAPAGMTYSKIALQQGGKLVVVENTPPSVSAAASIALARFDLNRNGALDMSFFGGVITGAGFADAAGLAVQRDGKILVAGAVGGSPPQVAEIVRLKANGTLDSSFGNLGAALGPRATGSDALVIGGVAVRSDGTIALAGASGFALYSAFSETFNAAGQELELTRTSQASNTIYHNVVARTDGIFAIGAETGRSAFGSMGPITPATPFVLFLAQSSQPTAVFVDAIAATPGNQVVVGGSSLTGWTLERFLGTNQPDSNFGTAGLASVPLDETSGPVALRALIGTADGKVLAVGNDFNNGVFLARLEGSSIPVRDKLAPTASLVDAPALTTTSAFEYFTVKYTDNVAVKASTIRGSNIVVKGPRAFGTRKAILVGTSGGDGSPLFATYAVAGRHGGLWTATDNSLYSVILQRGQVSDTSGNFAASAFLGTFTVSISAATPAGSRANASGIATRTAASTFSTTAIRSGSLLADGVDMLA